MVEHPLEDTHDVVIVGPRTLDIKRDEFCKVAVGVALFCTEGRANLKHALEATAHAKLLEQLRRLVEESRSVKVLHGKQVGTAFGRCGDDFWRMGFEEPLGDQVLATKLENLASKTEHGIHMRSAEVEETVVEARVKFNLHGVGHAQGQGCFGTCDDVHGRRKYFVGGRWGGLTFLDLGWSLECHGAGELEGGFSGHALDGVKGFLADVVRLEEDLGFSCAVAKVDETDGAFAAVGLHEPDHSDFSVNEVGSICLEFAKGMGSVRGGDPGGHALGAEAKNMKHSLRPAHRGGWPGPPIQDGTNRRRHRCAGQSPVLGSWMFPKSLEQRRTGPAMSTRAGRAVCCVLVLMMMSLSPMVAPASAHSSILLSVDVQHAVLEPGQSLNITLTIENNASAIESFNVTIDEGNLASVWTVLPVDATVDNVFPTWAKNTTLVVRLAEGATVADSGSFTVNVTEPDSGHSSMITVLVSVAPAYHPSLSVDNSPLVHLGAGETTDIAFTAHNLGTVTDTFLLDVEVQPDLASWWANHTNTSTGNNSGNASGGGNATDNGTGGGSGNGTNTTSVAVLMMGNSYTNGNNLATLVDDIMDAEGYNGSVTALTGGGMMLTDHWQNLNTSGHQWNTTLRSQTLDYVILQDQSQVPSLPSSDSYWQESKNASVLLSNEIEAEGAETVLLMTWGRRSGESGTQWHQYSNINQNFTAMQEGLAEGYTRYAENISSAGNTVWMAPVGLAFETVHDSVVADGDDPTASGNLFYDLYDSDGSHPSLSGSYLAACVLHSTTTGDTCVGSNDTVALSASVKLALQQAADDTVFNQTAGMSYYPWEISGTAAFGLGSSVPQGWYIQWQDDELSNIAAGGAASATLSITVPADAAPDYYGYRLTVGSTNGNITSSTVLVVEVESEPSIATAFLRQSDAFLPGSGTLTAVQVENTGNTALNIDWTLAASSSSGTNPCTGSLVTAMSTGLAPGGIEEVEMLIDVDETVDSTASCAFTLTATHNVDGLTETLDVFDFTVEVDEAVNISLTGPLSAVEIVPAEGANYEVRLTNHGSDDATFFLDVEDSAGLTTVLVSSSGIIVQAGEVGTWTVNTKGDASISGMLQQAFSASYNGATATLQVAVHLLEVDGASLLPPGEDRVLLAPGESTTMALTLVNSGTSNLTFLPTLSGLPVDVEVVGDLNEVVLAPGAQQDVNITFAAATGATPASSPVVLTYQDGTFSVSYSFDVVVVDREEVVVNSVQQRLFASPLTTSSMNVEVVNLGTASDLFVVEWSTESQGNWFEFTVSPTTFQLSPGASQQVAITVREVASGAPDNGVVYTLRAVSTSNEAVNDAVNITIEPVLAAGELSVRVDKDSAGPGEAVFGSVVLTNTGNAEDTFSITTVGEDCGLDASVTVGAGLSSEPLGWSCLVPNDADAGQRGVSFRAVSAVRSNVAIEQVALYTVEVDWPGDSLVALAFSEGQVSLGVDSSTSVVFTVTNLGNAELSGTLDTSGEDTGLVVFEWQRMSDDVATSDYTLSSGSSVDFLLTITSNTARAATSELTVRATSTGGGVLTTDKSIPLPITIEGPALPPNGLSLPLGVEVSQSAALGAMGAGWLLALVAIQLLRRRSDATDSDAEESVEEEEEDPEEKDLPELGYNECRLDGESKVNCPTCDARLGVPRGSTPPFRFTCPQCDNKIRVVE